VGIAQNNVLGPGTNKSGGDFHRGNTATCADWAYSCCTLCIGGKLDPERESSPVLCGKTENKSNALSDLARSCRLRIHVLYVLMLFPVRVATDKYLNEKF
jgi:hypothetical protein